MNIIPCAICGNTHTKKFLTSYDKYLRVDNKRFTLVQCKICGLVYTNPQPSIDELAKYYPSHYPSYISKYNVFERNRFLEFLKRIKKLFSPSHPKVSPSINQKKLSAEISLDTSRLCILDFGCGSGRFLLSMRRTHPFWEMYGFDIATNKKIKSLDKKTSIILDTPDTLSSYFKKDSLDRIYLNNVLEHVNDPAEILQVLSTLLKPDGEMIIGVPNIDSIKFKIFRSNFFPLEIPRHLYQFSPSTLSMLCKKCGLHIINIRKIGSAKGTVRSIYYTLGIHKDKIDPLLFAIVDRLTNIFGKERIDDDSMVVRVKKIVSSTAQKKD